MRLTTSMAYDYLNRLMNVSAANLSQSSIYNDANQRTRVYLADGSYWVYEYDTLGQVTFGKKHWSDGTPVAGQQFEYTFDDIGNRIQTKARGDETGANLRPPLSREEISRNCLDAHKTLMDLNPDNIPKFKDVAKFLAEDLRQSKDKQN